MEKRARLGKEKGWGPGFRRGGWVGGPGERAYAVGAEAAIKDDDGEEDVHEDVGVEVLDGDLRASVERRTTSERGCKRAWNNERAGMGERAGSDEGAGLRTSGRVGGQRSVRGCPRAVLQGHASGRLQSAAVAIPPRMTPMRMNATGRRDRSAGVYEHELALGGRARAGGPGTGVLDSGT